MSDARIREAMPTIKSMRVLTVLERWFPDLPQARLIALAGELWETIYKWDDIDTGPRDGRFIRVLLQFEEDGQQDEQLMAYAPRWKDDSMPWTTGQNGLGAEMRCREDCILGWQFPGTMS